MTALLDGIRVLDLTRALAGPLSTALLADFGAEVVKVEPVGVGDLTRGWPPHEDGDSLYFASVNRGKESLALDFRSADARDILVRLVSAADVLVENFRPGVLAEIGLTDEVLAEANPDLVVVGISGFGPVGPRAADAGLDQIAQGMSGLMSVTGAPGQPFRVGIPIIDVTAGLHAALAVCAGLVRRERTGSGARIQTSLLETAISIMTFQAQAWLSLGEVPVPAGNDHPTIAPYGLFATADAPINIAVSSPKAWETFCRVIDRPDLLTEPDYGDGAARLRNRPALRLEIEKALAERTSAEWIGRIASAGIPCGPVHEMDAVFADPQVRALDMVQHVVDDHGRGRPLLRGPFWVDGDAVAVGKAPPASPGVHSGMILRRNGFTTAEVEGLQRRGVVA